MQCTINIHGIYIYPVYISIPRYLLFIWNAVRIYVHLLVGVCDDETLQIAKIRGRLTNKQIKQSNRQKPIPKTTKQTNKHLTKQINTLTETDDSSCSCLCSFYILHHLQTTPTFMYPSS